jgi:hypothetical protein
MFHRFYLKRESVLNKINNQSKEDLERITIKQIFFSIRNHHHHHHHHFSCLLVFSLSLLSFMIILELIKDERKKKANSNTSMASIII